MLILDELRYSEQHIWVRQETDRTVTMGITDYAQTEMGDLSYVELPNEGDSITVSEPFGSIECADLVADLYAPLCGHVLEVNQEVIDDPAIISEAPYGRGWILRVEFTDQEEFKSLMSPDDYEEYILTVSR